jgi:hypothetical protein
MRVLVFLGFRGGATAARDRSHEQGMCHGIAVEELSEFGGLACENRREIS